MASRHAVLLTPAKSSHPRQLLSRQQDAPISLLAATLVDLSASVANKELTGSLSPLDSALTKNRGGGMLWLTCPRLAHPTRMRILPPPTTEESTHGSDHVGKDSPASLLARSFHSLHQECFTTLVQSKRSTLFLKNAGVSPYNSRSGNCSQDTTPKGHFFRPFLSSAYTLFQVPYPVSSFLATHTKTAGCVPTLPILKLAPPPASPPIGFPQSHPLESPRYSIQRACTHRNEARA